MENDLNECFEILDLTALSQKYFLLGLFSAGHPILYWNGNM
jgi:hypothetical protein